MKVSSKIKVLTLALSAAILIATSVIGTLAYLASQSTVVNEFSVGNVKIVVDETKVNLDGTVDTSVSERVDGNKYHLIPGKTYKKDPRVTVKAGSEESYVRMLVTIDKLKELKAIFGNDFLPQYYVEGWDNETWVASGLVENTTANTVTYEFRYYDKAAAKDSVDASSATDDIILPELFTSFTLPGKVTGEELDTIKDMKITVVGHAIQKSGFNSAELAWAAFEDQIK